MADVEKESADEIGAEIKQSAVDGENNVENDAVEALTVPPATEGKKKKKKKKKGACVPYL